MSLEELMLEKLPFNGLIVGITNCGKTKYVKDLLNKEFNQVFNFIFLICPTYNANDTWKNVGNGDDGLKIHIPDLRVKGDIDEYLQNINDLFYDNINKKCKILIIIDDCAASVDLKNRTSKLVELATGGRHLNISIWVITQQLTDVCLPFRKNVKFIVSFFNINKKSEDALFEEFGSRIDKKTRENILQHLENNKYSKFCLFENRYEVQIPNITF